ncbi:MAG: hypothetical protein ACMXYK_03555 [Candidatus Woesearchaeota archaeon]
MGRRNQKLDSDEEYNAWEGKNTRPSKENRNSSRKIFDELDQSF